MQMTAGERVYQVVAWILVGLIMLTCLVPAYYVVVTSLSTKADIMAHNGFVIFPRQFQVQTYEAFLKNANFIRAFGISLLRVAVAVMLQLSVCSLAAFSLCKSTLPGKKLFITIVIISLLVGPGMIPAYLWSIQNGTMNTFWIYVLPQAYSAWAILLFRQFFLDLPESLQESARIDGASEYQIMRSIVVPLSAPIFATIALFCAVGNWNDFTTNMIYVREQGLMTLAYYLRQTLMGAIDLSRSHGYAMADYGLTSDAAFAAPTESYRMTAVLIATLPIIMVYPFLQKYFATGMLTGAVKG